MQLDFKKEDATALIVVVTSIAGVLSHLKFDNSVTTAITGTGVIVNAVASYWKSRSAAKSARNSEQAAQDSARRVAEVAAKASTDNTAKTVLVQTVTSEREKWRAEMREHVAELVMLLRASARGEDEVSWRRVDQLATGIRLRFNPAGRGPSPSLLPKHENDRTVHAVLDDLGTTTPQGVTLHAGIADLLEASMAPMLKAVWEVSKKEAVDGKLQL